MPAAKRSASPIAIVVTFNPDVELLQTNVRAVSPQVAAVIIVDNDSANRANVETLASDISAMFVAMPSNGGIASALNAGINRAWAEGASAVLLLDQDSECSPRMVEELMLGLDEGFDVVSPSIADRNLDAAPTGAQMREGSVEIDLCITSGSLVRVATWLAVGGYDDQLFIDFVDFDFCLRVRAAGGHIARRPAAVLHHEIGRGVRHGGLVAYNHSAFRTGHMARDVLVHARKHRHTHDPQYGHRGILRTYAALLRKGYIIARFERDRRRKLIALTLGMASGTTRRLRSSPGPDSLPSAF
jgi:rhamnosyltransferase